MVCAQMKLPKEMIDFARLFHEAGVSLYAVGGLPRNFLLGVPYSDLDICSSMPPDQVGALCERNGIRHVDKAIAFGTIEIHRNGLIFEHTTFRKDSYRAGGGHRPTHVQFGKTLEEDAFRRDLTCNALYYDILREELIDPTGGRADIAARVLRATTNDPADILRDDGLRMLRLVRFSSELGFQMEKNTWLAAKAHIALLRDIAWERKRDELTKILLSDIRYPTLTAGEPSPVLRGLKMLHEMGALPFLLPELLEGDGIKQRPQYHAYDVLQHNLHACDETPPILTLRLAGLLHDVGKPAALFEKGLPADAGGHAEIRRDLLPHGVTPMLGHDVLGVEIAREMLHRLRFPNKLISDVLFLIEHHMYDLSGQAKESTLRARFVEFGRERSHLLCDMREADVRGSGITAGYVAKRWREILSRMEAERAPFSMGELDCTGTDILEWLNIAPGPQVGEIKLRLLKHCARRPADNTKERLKLLARGMVRGKGRGDDGGRTHR